MEARKEDAGKGMSSSLQGAGGSAALYIRKGQPWLGRPEGAGFE